MSELSLITEVGILIPTYNRREYLEKTMRSALEQTFAALEIIVIDNGSTDGTGDYMESITDHRVRYIVNEQNLGLLGSINKGVELFSPQVEWCTILPDDDLLDDSFVASMVAVQAESLARAVVHGKRLLIDGDGTVIREALPAPRDESAFEYLENRYKRKRETFLTGVFFSRKAFAAIGGYPCFATGMTTDDAFIFALALQDRLVYAEEAVACIRMHEGAESHDSRSVRHLAALSDFREYLCRMVAGAVVSGRHGNGWLKTVFPRVREGYIRALASSFWLRDVKALVRQTDETTASRIAELCDLVRKSGLPFSFRVRVSVAIRRWSGIFPERWLPYRAVWEAARRGRTSLDRLLQGRSRQ